MKRMAITRTLALAAALMFAGAVTLMAQNAQQQRGGGTTPAGTQDPRGGGQRRGGRGGPRPRVSPHETIYARLDGGAHRVMVVYGRPFSKTPNSDVIRKVWGELVPWGARWRLGSDEATLLITHQPLQIGSLNIPTGAYSLYMMPMENEASKLIVNKEIGQWGIGDAYHEEMEVGRVDLKKEDLDPQVDQLTLSITQAPGTPGGVLNIMWEKTKFSVPFTAKD